MLGVVAARQHDGQIRPQASQLHEGLLPGHVGHDQVEEHDVHVGTALAQDLEGGAATGRRQHFEAGALQELSRHLAHALVVVDDQHRSASLDARILQGARRFGARRAAAPGEQHLEARAASGLALDPDHPAVGAHESQHDGEPQTPARRLRGVEGIEDASAGVGTEALARVGHLDVDVGTRCGLGSTRRLRDLAGADVALAGAQRDGPRRAAERLGGVGDEVEDHLAQLRRIALDGRQARGQLLLERRTRAQ